ncbi:putative glycosyl hydrolase [Rhizodiscina lignyota]|uniref:beta-glucosidase n=1 Tax=Rhizodiscina lignyota TaxID=1504668 RepID=A0A9P4ILP8_9PEZI|nr:putative glycosyl hydrolase [Rhizodiscina lignyota]
MRPIWSAIVYTGQFSLAQEITDDTYFYGDSPPVYPSPEGKGVGQWAQAYAKAKAFVAKLTIEEKTNLTTGYSDTDNTCSGNIIAIPRLGFPGLCVSDAGNGLRDTDYVSSYPNGISVGASWNKKLAHDRGTYMGAEFKRKGVNTILGPVVGPLGRVVAGGRNWEGFTNDPYLNGMLVANTVTGAQGSGVQTCVKHYIGNEQETNRNPEVNSAGVATQSVSSNIDDTTLHELYLWPFQEAVKAGTASIMCSYNRVNNSYSCQNSKILNGLLKTELGFEGYVMSDWGAQHGGVASANAGLDMVMPNSVLWGQNLTTAVKNGSVKASRLNDMATRIMAAWYLLDQSEGVSSPGIGMKTMTTPHQRVIGISHESSNTILDGAIEGHVLVKNSKNALPMKSPQLVSVFGYDAQVPLWASQYGTITPNQYSAIYNNGTMFTAGGSGKNSPAYVLSPFDAISERAYQGGGSVYWDFSRPDPPVDPTSDACVVFINAWASEGSDRPALRDDFSDGLVLNVAANCSNTIVVIHNAGTRLVDVFQDHPNVTAIIYAHLPGQDTGRGLAMILYGDVSPSGRLPYTVAKNESDYGHLLNATQPEGEFALFSQSNFTEGQFIDYRYFDAHHITPRYEFGFGLSYSKFSYSNLHVQLKGSPSPYPAKASVQPGGNPHLFDVVATASVQVTNSGGMDAMDVPQLYVGFPGPNQPVKQLRAFEKVQIAKGQSTTVTFSLRRKDLSVWDAEAQQWMIPSGTHNIWVGASSRDLPLHTTLTVSGKGYGGSKRAGM